MAHAGANVVNDYYDALNGSDAGNSSRLFPFTGGSRFIQNGVLSLLETRRYGFGLLAAVVPAGLWLKAHSAGGLVWIGLARLLVAWAYSAPPLQLMARGAGEAAIVAGWLLVVLGTDFVQRGELAARPLVAGLPFALLGFLPVACALGLLPAALSCKAGRQLLRDADRPERLVPAIKATIAAANLQGLLMALALAL